MEEGFEISFSRTVERKGFSVLAITSNTFKVGYISIADKVNRVIFMTIINDLLYQIRFFGCFCFFLNTGFRNTEGLAFVTRFKNMKAFHFSPTIIWTNLSIFQIAGVWEPVSVALIKEQVF